MDAVETYLAAARTVVESVEHPVVREHWDRPSALERMSIGDLAAHTIRSLTQVQGFLDSEDPRSDHPVTAEAYFGDLDTTADLDSPLNVGVRERSRAGAAAGPDGVAAEARAALATLAVRLPAQPAGRQVVVFGGRPMLVAQYLRTRLVEFAVHHDDLLASLPTATGQVAEAGLPDLSDDARAAAVEVLFGTARHRHGDRAVLRALARRERDPARALRVF